MVTGVKYHTATGPLSGTRETQSHKNIDYTGVNYGGAGLPNTPVRSPGSSDGRSKNGPKVKARTKRK
jgi:hypothetical protein